MMVILICVASFTLYIRRLLINSNVKNKSNKSIDEKLDRIIQLLEEKNK
ncbi:DUF4083 family protein [Pseudalkalibacillus hwajinpoensis]|uniref:DUF4083 domain-containing protein n=1 Tax=Guptibacillus hwajinpoensis TaxID=208199 RepID=A0A4U1MPL0_9BACL|nr:DUF4083 family protein [Pseudalkalibacillus hwajinpoensis]TKD72655.1 DUF4083 domain-containing protein [Pseudalkalibacillus hwajinpoensis]